MTGLTIAKRPKLLPLGKIKLDLDDLFSLAVRMEQKRKGPRCAFADFRKCGGLVECCFHFVRKSRSLALRYDFRNAVGSCIACNGYMEHNEGPFWTWYALTFGVEQMVSIQAESHQPIYASRFWLDGQRAAIKERMVAA